MKRGQRGFVSWVLAVTLMPTWVMASATETAKDADSNLAVYIALIAVFVALMAAFTASTGTNKKKKENSGDGGYIATGATDTSSQSGAKSSKDTDSGSDSGSDGGGGGGD